MKSYRIGSDRVITWKINLNGQPLDLSKAHSIELIASCPGRMLVIDPEDYAISNNAIIWHFKGASQHVLGPYSLVCVINKGEDGQLTFDQCDAFSLVKCSCQETLPDDEDVVDVSSLNFTTSVGFTSEVYPILRVKARGMTNNPTRELVIESSLCLDNETVSLARKMSSRSRITYKAEGSWKKVNGRKRNGWRIDRRFSTNPTDKDEKCVLFELHRSSSPSKETPRYPRKLYVYKIWVPVWGRYLLIQDLLSPVGLYYDRYHTEDYAIYWGRHKKNLPYYNLEQQNASQRHFQFGIAVGRQIAPFKLRMTNQYGQGASRSYLIDARFFRDEFVTFVG